MKARLRKLADYAKANNIRIYHRDDARRSQSEGISARISMPVVKRIAGDDGYMFVDLLPAFGGLSRSRSGRCPGIPIPTRWAIA